MTGTLADLREPFPAGTVGKLPKPLRKDAPKGKCQECGGYHGLPAVHLDYVGHAAVTDRLLNVDPTWTWEPLGVDQATGLPVLDREGNLWIRLTVLGVTRLGVGDGPTMKERIGDALRNAAMRFGVALSLWTKDELESGMVEHRPPEPERRGHQEMVSAAEARKRIYTALRESGLEPDAARAAGRAAWGDRGETPIDPYTLADLMADLGIQDGEPFANPETGELLNV